MYYASCERMEVCADVVGVFEELRGVSVWAMIDDEAVEGAGAAVVEGPSGGWAVRVLVFCDAEVVEILRDGVKVPWILCASGTSMSMRRLGVGAMSGRRG